MHRWTRLCVAIATVLIMASTLEAQRGPAPLRFRFGFGALTGKGVAQKLTRISGDTRLKTGDRLKMMVELQQAGFVYILYRSPVQETELLFPPTLKTTIRAAQRYTVPEDATWLELDEHTGTETFYVLVSARRLTNLE